MKHDKSRISSGWITALSLLLIANILGIVLPWSILILAQLAGITDGPSGIILVSLMPLFAIGLIAIAPINVVVLTIFGIKAKIGGLWRIVLLLVVMGSITYFVYWGAPAIADFFKSQAQDRPLDREEVTNLLNDCGIAKIEINSDARITSITAREGYAKGPFKDVVNKSVSGDNFEEFRRIAQDLEFKCGSVYVFDSTKPQILESITIDAAMRELRACRITRVQFDTIIKEVDRTIGRVQAYYVESLAPATGLLLESKDSLRNLYIAGYQKARFEDELLDLSSSCPNTTYYK